MKKRILLLSVFAFSVLALFFISGCEKESQFNTTVNNDEAIAKEKLIEFISEHNYAPRFGSGTVVNSTLKSGTISEQGNRLDLSTIPDYSYYQRLVEQAINQDDYDCSPTYIDDYIIQSVDNWTSNDFLFYNYFGGIAFDYVYVFSNANGGQYYGSNGQFSNATNRTFKDLLRFWNIPTDILIRDTHGLVYDDEIKVKAILLLYGYSDDDATYLSGLIKTVFGSSAFMNYKHPLLTFNAFAADADPNFGTGKKIVMGDGILEAYADLGFGDVAPQAILAHEYGHHVQFAKNVEFVSSPEGTRRVELMADAFAAYYLTHKRGATMNWKRVQQFLVVFYGLGDCSFNSNGHHGTPNQRIKAATFGYKIANDAKLKGKILTSEEFIALFDAEFPNMIAPDAN
ncbi:MAG TPA: hypothetical protein PLC80_09655 [Draconibacterium sp.]|nr:hypothetical protein [Draconibacterium sp.]